MKLGLLYLSILILIVLAVAGRSGKFVRADLVARPGASLEPVATAQDYTLETAMREGRMVYVGVGGAIDGQINPELVAQTGTRVRVTLVNGDGMSHDFSIDDLAVKTPFIKAEGSTTEVTFSASAGQEGIYDYFCTVSGHRQAGMAGKFVVR